MDEYKNRFEKSLARINKYVESTDDWTDEDYEHIKAVTDALQIAREMEDISIEYGHDLCNSVDLLEIPDVNNNPNLCLKCFPLPRNAVQKAKNKVNKRTFSLIKKFLDGDM